MKEQESERGEGKGKEERKINKLINTIQNKCLILSVFLCAGSAGDGGPCPQELPSAGECSPFDVFCCDTSFE